SLALRLAAPARYDREPTRPARQRCRTPQSVEERAGVKNHIRAALKEVQSGDERHINVAHRDGREPSGGQRPGDLGRIELALVAAVILVVVRPQQTTTNEEKGSMHHRA